MELFDDCLHKQDDLPYKCYKTFDDMRQKKELCDVILNVGNRSIHAHKVILAASIPYFRSSFGFGAGELQYNDILLQNVSTTALEALVDFAYRCEVRITMENAELLLSASCFLQVDCVRNACVEFLVKAISPRNVINLLELGNRLGCSDLANKSDDYITENFDEICQCKDFFDQPYSYVRDVLSRDNLHVTSEEKVFEALVNWIETSPHQRSNEIPELLSCVRMPYLKLEYLRDKVATNELVRGNLACRDILDDTRDYHLFPDRRKDANSWKFSTTSRRYKLSGFHTCKIAQMQRNLSVSPPVSCEASVPISDNYKNKPPSSSQWEEKSCCYRKTVPDLTDQRGEVGKEHNISPSDIKPQNTEHSNTEQSNMKAPKWYSNITPYRNRPKAKGTMDKVKAVLGTISGSPSCDPKLIPAHEQQAFRENLHRRLVLEIERTCTKPTAPLRNIKPAEQGNLM